MRLFIMTALRLDGALDMLEQDCDGTRFVLHDYLPLTADFAATVRERMRTRTGTNTQNDDNADTAGATGATGSGTNAGTDAGATTATTAAAPAATSTSSTTASETGTTERPTVVENITRTDGFDYEHVGTLVFEMRETPSPRFRSGLTDYWPITEPHNPHCIFRTHGPTQTPAPRSNVRTEATGPLRRIDERTGATIQ